MKKNEKTLKTAMDRRLSFLDELPSCRAAVQYRIAQEEEPVMKKKMSLGLIFAIVLVLISAAALAASLLLSPRVSASRIADKTLEEVYGITDEMQTFFAREEHELSDGAFEVTYSGIADLNDVLGTYTAVVKDGKAEINWSHDGEDVSGGYEAEAWGTEQLKQMIADSTDPGSKKAFKERALKIAEKHNAAPEDEDDPEPSEGYFEQLEADKAAAFKACKLSEDEMTETALKFITESYGLNEEQISRLELYTNSYEDNESTWYEMVDGKPCFMVEYLLYSEGFEKGDRTEKDGYYIVFVNVETGVIEQYEYNSALAGVG